MYINTLLFTSLVLTAICHPTHLASIRAQQAEKARTFALLKSVLAEEQKRRAAERYIFIFVCLRFFGAQNAEHTSAFLFLVITCMRVKCSAPRFHSNQFFFFFCFDHMCFLTTSTTRYPLNLSLSELARQKKPPPQKHASSSNRRPNLRCCLRRPASSSHRRRLRESEGMTSIFPTRGFLCQIKPRFSG